MATTPEAPDTPERAETSENPDTAERGADASADADADACDVAHGRRDAARDTRTLIAVFATPVADYLLRYAADAGFRALLVEPDAKRVADAPTQVPDLSDAPGTADIVVTDHHRDELGPVLRDALAQPARWVGVMGNPRHEGPHRAALRELGVSEDDIARVHRPIGLNIGSRTPPEIAVATLAGLLADRNERAGGFSF
ncbi:xanthine/CO dehydrogenase XdhC/CoxF family maturation factor [Prauserella isguenensis]|uniref:Xanthine/CO dehydrogenase XdhC/CoxF family maturation factor n=1 Tax=Prauserella isguenensis TaxID=1470180 RepID=A0A839S5Z1_9PSEU|nr:XdhC family protein [Prauserella isguenensis]MBB3053265.1 xanthine/CO dehydrogenase XdhC/CoxF family maturation factor [Prauserella isguenensis]